MPLENQNLPRFEISLVMVGGNYEVEAQSIPCLIRPHIFMTAGRGKILRPTHWLDRVPAVRDWLDSQARDWWVKGVVAGRCREYRQLQGHEQLLQGRITAEYENIKASHAHRVVDTRSQTHISLASLVLATHKTLLPFLKDEQQVQNIITEHMGARTTPLLVALMKLASWFQADHFDFLCGRLRGLQMDYGNGFQTQLEQGPLLSKLTVERCLYYEIFTSESAPQLTSCCCCSQDKGWLEAVPGHKGIIAGLLKSRTFGDSTCCFVVQKV